MLIESINREQFLGLVAPAMQGCSADELANLVSEHWTPRQLCILLRDPARSVRRVVCSVLALVGDGRVENCLFHALLDEDSGVVDLAEHALWSIWFRSGTDEAQRLCRRGLVEMEQNRPRRAIGWFRRAQIADSRFAEAYNQSAIAHYLLEEWEASLEACHRTLHRVPRHFGALAGLGHCHAQCGDLAEAGRCYRRALEVNPSMDGVAETLQRIQESLILV